MSVQCFECKKIFVKNKNNLPLSIDGYIFCNNCYKIEVRKIIFFYINKITLIKSSNKDYAVVQMSNVNLIKSKIKKLLEE